MAEIGFTIVVLFAVSFDSVHSVCPNGWMRYDSSCYLFEDVLEPWHTAQTYCERLNANLVRVETPRENNFIKETLKKLFSHCGGSGIEFWMGGNDIAVENDWVWSDGQQITNLDFAPGEPNGNRITNCLRFSGEAQYQWDDARCDDKESFICEIQTD